MDGNKELDDGQQLFFVGLLHLAVMCHVLVTNGQFRNCQSLSFKTEHGQF